MSKQPPYVTVTVELEEWDDTTDAIVWLIEQKYSDLSLPKLEISKNPHTWRGGIENLEDQNATLDAWTKDNQKICLDFIAEYAEIPEKETGETYYEDGYKITVYEGKLRGKKLAEYTIKGTDRKEFQIIKEQTTR